ncbi:MAG: NAD-dependent epimerase/dehydratase family protein [Anaerolineae bacterium]|nr:NAD-dependent epimerase/dehydratase family protein [Anaerolineae bacterium]
MILVTGATGHLGNVLVRQLVAKGVEVRTLVLPHDDTRVLEGLAVEQVQGDVLDPTSLRHALSGVEVVYHLAGIISIMPGAERLMRRVNIEGVRNVATAARETNVRRMVHVSSIHAFRRMPAGVVVDEAMPLALESPEGTYDYTKAMGTVALLDAVRAGLDAVVVCPTAVIGPHDYRGSFLGNALLNFARRRLHFLIPGAYDFVDVRDIAQGLQLAACQGQPGEIYILAGTHASLIEVKTLIQGIARVHSAHVVLPWCVAMACADLLQHVYRLTGIKPKYTPYSLCTLRDNAHFSSQKARHGLGFETRALEQTLGDLLLWHRSLQPA